MFFKKLTNFISLLEFFKKLFEGLCVALAKNISFKFKTILKRFAEKKNVALNFFSFKNYISECLTF
jgi:hypothetical protein